MRLKKHLMGLLMAVALAACSSDHPADNGSESPEIGQGENFISVSIEMPATAGSRATTDDGLFDDGTENESKVSNIVFFFFDEGGNCIEVQKKDNPVFKDPAQPSMNPNITNYGIVDVKLKAGLKYDRVAVALNSPASDATSLKSEINTIDDLLERTVDYVAKSKVNEKEGFGQVMSNSVYFDMATANDKPVEDKKIDVVKITQDNIYSSDEKDNIDGLIAAGTKKYVEIFVERVLARVDVSKPEFDMTNYYINEENGVKKTAITVYDYANNSSRQVTVRPVVMGMAINVCAPKTALIKPINFNELGYGLNTNLDKDFCNFQWNDPLNKRSYWASTAFLAAKDMKYVSWNGTVDKGLDGFTQYIHPNTQACEPTFENEGSSLNTKVMVVAELHEFEGSTDKGAVDLVMFGQDYMLYNDFRAHVANLVNRDVQNIDWNDVEFKSGETVVTLTDEQKKAVAKSVSDAFSGEAGNSHYVGADFELVVANTADNDTGFGDRDWIAKVQKTAAAENKTITLDGLPSIDALTETNSLLKQVTTKITETIASSVRRINDKDNNLMYWKGGCTYFYTNIRHQGFTGLTGNGNNFLYGVVRNHMYRINLQGIYGLGTPVIEPARPINPDRPGGGNPSYIKAKINILPWRVVTNNATIH